MGMIRVLLALSVVLVHLGAAKFHLGTGGRVAVQSFFMVSGFYISMALASSYASSPGSFWLNRALRLYPTYLAIAALTLLARSFGTDFIQQFKALPAAAQHWMEATNLLIFGQDWTMFMGVTEGALRFVTDFRDSSPPLHKFLLVDPAWSLGVELTFYALAPWLLRLRSAYLTAIVGASLLLRVGLFRAGLYEDPWSYRFFPTELALFLVGALAYRATPVLAKAAWVARMGKPVTLMLCALVVGYVVIPIPEPVKSIAFLALFAAALPTVFQHSKNSSVDRRLGDLSYPLYVSHMLVLNIVAKGLRLDMTLGTGAAVVAVTLAVAGALCLLIDVPVQRLRAKVRRHAADAPFATPPIQAAAVS